MVSKIALTNHHCHIAPLLFPSPQNGWVKFLKDRIEDSLDKSYNIMFVHACTYNVIIKGDKGYCCIYPSHKSNALLLQHICYCTFST